MESYTIHPICAGRFASAEKSNFAYQKSAGEKLAAPILMYLVTGKNTCMLVDTGCCDEAWAAAYHHPLTQTEDMKPVNALKKLAGIGHRMKLISPIVIEPIQNLKTRHLGNHNPRLHTDEILIALSISAATNPTAEQALKQLPKLRGCEAHSTVILSQVDDSIFRKLGINLTCEPKYQTKKLYHK